MAAEQIQGGYRSIALVDLSYLFKKEWHSPAAKESPESAAQNTLAKISGVRESVEHVIICCDYPPYRRAEIYPQYKAQREKPTDGEVSWKRWLMDRIEKDGYQIARCKGYEADDIIATLCKAYGFWCPDVRIIGSDKDAAQCVTESVRMFVPAIGNRPAEIRGPKEIVAKFGVEPKDMALWLALTGDKIDNIPGVPGVGAKKAAQLITDCKTLTGIAEALAMSREDDKPSAMWNALAANWEQLARDLKLTELDTTVPVDVAGLLEKKEPVRLVEDDVEEAAEAVNDDNPADDATEAEFVPISRAPEGYVAPALTVPRAKSEPPPKQESAALARTGTVTEDLQPLDIDSGWRLARMFTNGRLYGKFTNPEAIFTIIVKARELGLKVTTALDGFHIIEGKPSASADMIRSLSERHPDCEYLQLIESTAESATWETKHRRHPKPTRYTYTIAEARQAGLNAGNWQKRPRDMLCKTAGSKLARLVYPGAVMGLYSPEEMDQ